MTASSPNLIELEKTLILRVKDDQDSAALVELINMHTGIYFTIASKYANQYPDKIKINDISDDKMFNIYKFILEYKSDQGMKLGTYIGQRTDYMCKDILKKEDHNPLSATLGSLYADGGASMFSDHKQESSTVMDGSTVTLTDNTDFARPSEVANNDIALEDIMKAAANAEVCTDPRFVTILKYKHFNSPKRSLTWREIGPLMGISYEMARKVYIKNLKLVKDHLNAILVTT